MATLKTMHWNMTTTKTTGENMGRITKDWNMVTPKTTEWNMAAKHRPGT